MRQCLVIALVGLFLCLSAVADEPTTAPATQIIADLKIGRIEIAGKVFAFGTSADALVDQFGKPSYDSEEDGDRLISYMESLGFSADASHGKLTRFTFNLRKAPGAVMEHARANAKTVEGIGANSTREQIENAYGKPESVGDLTDVTMLTYARATFFLDKDGLFLMMMSDEQ